MWQWHYDRENKIPFRDGQVYCVQNETQFDKNMDGWVRNVISVNNKCVAYALNTITAIITIFRMKPV